MSSTGVNNRKVLSSLLLLLTAMIWGIAFVAQSVGMEHVGPWTFVFARYVVSTIVLLPVSLFSVRKRRSYIRPSKTAIRTYLLGGMTCGAFLGTASIAQQIGIQYTTAGKAGFITALYVVLVPVIGIVFGKLPQAKIWLSVVIGLFGLYLISIREGLTIGQGDGPVMLCALVFSMQILSVDYFSGRLGNVIVLSNLQFAFSSLLALFGMLYFEHPVFADIKAAALPILYAGALSGAVGYTLQIIAQKHTEPAVASLLMSLESVFSALAGWVILHQVLSGRELVGCALVFGAVLLAELPVEKAAARLFSAVRF